MRKVSLIALGVSLAVLAILFSGCSPGMTSTPVTSPPPAKPAQAAKLAFTVQPPGAIAGQPLGTQPVVTIQDSNGNTVTGSILPVTLTITPGAGGSDATLFGPSKINAVNGVAKFTGLSIQKAGAGYTLTATSGNLAPATSVPFTILPGASAKLEFTRQPGGAIAGSPLTPQPQVTVQDAYGNKVAGYEGPVILNFTFASASGTARLSGKTTVNAVDSVATFTDISINRTWISYTLTATSGALAPATSNAFAISAAAPVKLEFTVQPAGAKAGAPFDEQPKVAAVDTFGNVATKSSPPVTVSVTPGTGASGAVLSGTRTVEAGDGLAVFEDLSINLPGTGYTLTATATGLTPDTSQKFDVTAP